MSVLIGCLQACFCALLLPTRQLLWLHNYPMHATSTLCTTAKHAVPDRKRNSRCFTIYSNQQKHDTSIKCCDKCCTQCVQEHDSYHRPLCIYTNQIYRSWQDSVCYLLSAADTNSGWALLHPVTPHVWVASAVRIQACMYGDLRLIVLLLLLLSYCFPYQRGLVLQKCKLCCTICCCCVCF